MPGGPGLWVLALVLGILVAIVLTFRVGARMGRSYDARQARRDSEAPLRVCSTCRSDMEYQGLRELGGDDATPLEMYACPACRKVDHYLPPAAVEDRGRATLERSQEKP